MTRGGSLRILTGWRRALARGPFFFRALGYALRPGKYPLFRLAGRPGGLAAVLKLEASLHLTKTLVVGGRQFTTPSLPGHPSRAFDGVVARGGLDFASAGTPANRNIGYVILGIAPECGYACAHCYEASNLHGGGGVPGARWGEVIRQLQDAGAGVIVLSGGEPMLRFGTVLALLQGADKDRSDFHLHTSGDGVTAERARALRAAGLSLAAVGLDDVDAGRFDALRGSPGAFRRATAALEHFAAAGLLTCTNLCLTRELVRSGGLWRYFDLARDLGVGMVQLLEPKPCGGYRGRTPEALLDEDDRRAVRDFVRQGNTERRYARHPLLYDLAELERSPMIGCTMGGITHFAIDTTGRVIPCVFAQVSFGSILEEDLAPILARMRQAVPRPIHGGCPSVLLGEQLAALTDGRPGHAPDFAEIQPAWERTLYGARSD